YTSALATATFLEKQHPEGTAFVIGELGLSEALHKIGYVQTTIDPEFVVLGETFAYNIEQITKAIRLVKAGARFVATNPDPIGNSEEGIEPACGAMAALIERATDISPFFVGKPNPLMMRSALNYLDVHSEDTIMIGDRMDTDVLSGISSGLDTALVLSGVTAREDVGRYPYRPRWIFESVAEIFPKELD
ncbi:MAG TPA: TIGR01457 family HAD-type hydrolase, partial [Anaerolineaceae bacterium]